MTLELEFTVEPFEAGAPGPHVRAAEDAARAAGGQLAIGPFGTSLSGTDEVVLAAVGGVVRAALAEGATRVTLQVSTRASEADRPARQAAGDHTPEVHPDRAHFLMAVEQLVDALGGSLVPVEEAEPFDTPVVWRGEAVAAVRTPALHGALDRLFERVAEEMGAPLAELPREEKQRAVQLLDERGAFTFRRSIEDAAQALQVSRFTVYNYLSRTSDESQARGSVGRGLASPSR